MEGDVSLGREEDLTVIYVLRHPSSSDPATVMLLATHHMSDMPLVQELYALRMCRVSF